MTTATDPDAGTPLPTGLEDLDTILDGGLRSGQLAVITGATGVGKSFLALNLFRHCSITLGRPAVLFTWEMSNTDITMRILAAESGVNMTRMRTGAMDDADWERLRKHCDPHAGAYHLADSTQPTVAAVRTAFDGIERLPELVVIDYVQMLEWDTPADVVKNVRRLKLLALEYGTAVLAVSQLYGPVGLEALACEDADVVMTLHRCDDDSPRAGEADIHVRQRSGPEGVATVAAQLHYARFASMAG